MRPSSIVKFERLYLISLLLVLAQQVVGFFLARNLFSSFTGEAHFPAGAGGTFTFFMVIAMLFSLVLAVGVPLLFWWLAASKRQEFAKWVLLVLSVLSVLGWLFSSVGLFMLPPEFTDVPVVSSFRTMQTVLVSMDLVAELLGIAALTYLFRQDAVAWFRNPGPTVSADIFR